MAKKGGLGKGLDSLIPDFYDENFDSNTSVSLEDLLEDNDTNDVKSDDEELTQEKKAETQEETPKNDQVEEIIDDVEIKVENELNLTEREIENINEVKEIVSKNPRITLWSSQSACVFRYLRKTEPEFSISKEASILIDEAVSKKYPKIWKMFEED